MKWKYAILVVVALVIVGILALGFGAAVGIRKFAPALNPTLAQFYAVKGANDLNHKDYDTAIVDFGHALKLSPKMVNAWVLRSRAGQGNQGRLGGRERGLHPRARTGP